jgi:L-threonylcarbamoyladenylate synthase
MKTASASGSPVGIAAPSANRFGRVSPTRASHVAADLGNDIAMILDGGHCAVGLESTIVGANDAGRPEILRPGMLTPARLMDVLQPWTSLEALAWLPVSPAPAGKHSAPGTLASHYAPQKPLMLVPPDDWPVALARLGAAGKRAGVWASQPMTSQPVVAVWLARPSEATLAAQGLYEAMRVLDAHPDVEVILMESVSAEALAQTGTGWTAIADRLARASAAGQASEAQASHPLSETPNPAG